MIVPPSPRDDVGLWWVLTFGELLAAVQFGCLDRRCPGCTKFALRYRLPGNWRVTIVVELAPLLDRQFRGWS